MANFHGLHCAETVLPGHRRPLSVDGCIRFPLPDRRSFVAADPRQDDREVELSGVSEEIRLRLPFTDSNPFHSVTIAKVKFCKKVTKVLSAGADRSIVWASWLRPLGDMVGRKIRFSLFAL